MPLLLAISMLVFFLTSPLFAAPVHDAARAGDVITVATLVDNDPAVTPDLPSLGGNTPLLEAAKAEKIDVMRFLIIRNANINHTNTEGYSALMYAVEAGNLPMVNMLLDKGAEPNIRNKKGYTPLILGAYSGRLEIVRALVEKGADIAMGDSRGVRALTYAVNFPAVAKYLSKKADAQNKTR